MTGARRFLFDQDFRNPSAGEAAAREAAALAEAEERGFARGRAQGRAEAEAQANTNLANSVARLAQAAAVLLQGADESRARLEEEGLALALALARKIAGEALASQALPAIAAVAREAFQHLRGVPHLVVRVNDGLVEEVDALMRRLARERGYEGRIVVMGEPDLRPGDARLEWADGGISREGARLADNLARTLTQS